jgi:hypothetical protein
MVMEKQRRPAMLRRITAFVLAAAVMVVMGSAAQSFFVQEAWSMAAAHADGTAALAAIPFADRVSWAAHDLGAMIRPYAALTSIALLIALLIAGTVAKFTGFRSIVFGVAGASAIFTLFMTLKVVLGTVGIFGARGAAGLAAQMAVGLAAAVLFAQLTRPHKS